MEIYVNMFIRSTMPISLENQMAKKAEKKPEPVVEVKKVSRGRHPDNTPASEMRSRLSMKYFEARISRQKTLSEAAQKVKQRF